MEECTARMKAINSSRGDNHQEESYHSNISDDDTILDLSNDFSKVEDTGYQFGCIYLSMRNIKYW